VKYENAILTKQNGVALYCVQADQAFLQFGRNQSRCGCARRADQIGWDNNLHSIWPSKQGQGGSNWNESWESWEGKLDVWILIKRPISQTTPKFGI